MSFILSKEYQTLQNIFSRLKKINTEANRMAFDVQMLECQKLAKNKYGNYGYNEKSDTYTWCSFNQEELAPPMIKCWSDFFKCDMFVAEDGSVVIFKTDKKKYVTYSKDELEIIKMNSNNSKRRIHCVKEQFEGEIHERNTNTEKDKKMAERARKKLIHKDTRIDVWRRRMPRPGRAY